VAGCRVMDAGVFDLLLARGNEADFQSSCNQSEPGAS
jgi:hypothetical protein